jgi:hypothetical protein
MAAATLLGPRDRPQVGDIVVYTKGVSSDGFVDTDTETTHSAIVTEVNAVGIVTKVRSKLGGFLTPVEHHPYDPFVFAAYGDPTFIFRK